jgi:hypothetical protein
MAVLGFVGSTERADQPPRRSQEAEKGSRREAISALRENRPGRESFRPLAASLRRNPREESTVDKLIPKNTHPIERALRVALGLALVAIAFVGPKTPWGFVGLVPLLTGAIGSCPLYTLFGWSTWRSGPKTSTT